MYDVNESGVFQVEFKTEHKAMPKNMFAQHGWFSISSIIIYFKMEEEANIRNPVIIS